VLCCELEQGLRRRALAPEVGTWKVPGSASRSSPITSLRAFTPLSIAVADGAESVTMVSKE
jgi:hypothetical protein